MASFFTGVTMDGNHASAKPEVAPTEVDGRDIPQVRVKQIARIKALLTENGLSLLGIDRKYDLPRGTAGTTLREPNPRGERAIAAALGSRPEFLWRDRYHASGQRKSPQDYTRPPTFAQRRKAAEAQT